jgi:nitroimidazol reductase NimA-like FMN-containing flavoprotein (pyridoxamine 5'-phosphate oxidase superfamily)
MRSLSESEIRTFLDEWTWGTLIAIEGDKPYAIELSYATDGAYVYCGSMPGGRMARCVKDNTNVVFKVCDSSKDTSHFRAVIVEGTVKKLTQRDEIIEGLGVSGIKFLSHCHKGARREGDRILKDRFNQDE